MSNWLYISLAAIILFVATWYGAEWLARRVSDRAGRRQGWRKGDFDDDPDAARG